jgi:hypothetical protein
MYKVSSSGSLSEPKIELYLSELPVFGQVM